MAAMAIRMSDLNAAAWQDNESGCPSKQLCPGVELLLASRESMATFREPGRHLVFVIRGKGRCLVRKSLLAIGPGVLFAVEARQPMTVTPSRGEDLVLLHIHQPSLQAGADESDESTETVGEAVAPDAEDGGVSPADPDQDDGGDWVVVPSDEAPGQAPYEGEPFATGAPDLPGSPEPEQPTSDGDLIDAGAASSAPESGAETVRPGPRRLRWNFPEPTERTPGSHGR